MVIVASLTGAKCNPSHPRRHSDGNTRYCTHATLVITAFADLACSDSMHLPLAGLGSQCLLLVMPFDSCVRHEGFSQAHVHGGITGILNTQKVLAQVCSKHIDMVRGLPSLHATSVVNVHVMSAASSGRHMTKLLADGPGTTVASLNLKRKL